MILFLRKDDHYLMNRRAVVFGFTCLVVMIAVGGLVATEALSEANNSQLSFSAKNTVDNNSQLNLRLELSINSTGLNYGKTIHVTAAAVNSLNGPNHVSAMNNWAFPNLLRYGQLCSSPVYIGFFKGYASDSNVSASTPLYSVPPPPWDASCILNDWTSFTFQPSSDMANTSSASVQQSGGVSPIEVADNYLGYYTTKLTTQGPNQTMLPQFIPFQPGTYTVLAGDEWGDFSLLYFTVS
jgi:hypothetical protein